MTGYTAKVGLRQPTPHAWDGCRVCVAYSVRRYGSVAHADHWAKYKHQ